MNKTDKAKMVKEIEEVRKEVEEKSKKELDFVAEHFYKKSQELGCAKESEIEIKPLSDKALAIKTQVEKLGSYDEQVAMASAFSTLLGEKITVKDDDEEVEGAEIPGTVVVLDGEESDSQPVLITSDGGYGVYWKKYNDGQSPYLTQISFSMGTEYRLATKEEILDLVVHMEAEAISAWLDENYERIYDELAI